VAIGALASPPAPVLAVCGWSGAGKTTLLKAVIPELVRRGLAVAVVKHDAHGLEVDRPGKDSDRLFRAGADVRLRGPGESFGRTHRGTEDDLAEVLAELVADHDLVLVEGHKGTPLPKVWLAGEEGSGPPADTAGVLEVLPRDAGRPRRFLALLETWLPAAWRAVPVLGGVLVGGTSTRMGRPKQLLPHRGATLLETVVTAVAPAVRDVVLLGAGPVPPGCGGLPRLADAPGLEGPLAGMLAAMRWAPGHAWLFAACDLPDLTAAAGGWLLGRREPGTWAVLPDLGRGVEPLLALYEPQARGPLEALAAAGGRAPRMLANHPTTLVVAPPAELRGCWRNVNTPEDFTELGG
jgi:molybdenum cofactor guanylyltransferase